MILLASLFQTEVSLNAMSDMPSGNSGRPYKACFENGTITIDTSKRYTTGLGQRRFGTGSVKTGSNPDAYPRNWLYSGWNNTNNRVGFVVALHRAALPTGGLAPEYSSNNQYAESNIYAVIEIPNAADGTVPSSSERSTFISNIRTALANDNINWGTVTSECGVLPAGVDTDPECTTDNYLGGWSNEDCGGYPSDGNNPDHKKKCASYCDGKLVAGDTYKYKNYFGTGYTEETVPEGTIICTYDKHNLPNRSAQWREDNPPVNCTADEDKVLGRGWGSTNGAWECVPKPGCKDLHNTNYADPDVRTHKNSVCDAGDCIAGADKKLLSSGDGSCIKELDKFVLVESETGCATGNPAKGYDDGKCRYEVAIGKSGWGKYMVAYRNFEGPAMTSGNCEVGTCDQFKAGKSGSRQYDTLEEAQAVFNTMKAGAQAAMNVTETDGDDGNGNGNGNGNPEITCASVSCSALNRDEHADTDPVYVDSPAKDCCGACSSGYEEDDNGECQPVEEDDNTLKMIGYGAAGLLGLLVISKLL